MVLSDACYLILAIWYMLFDTCYLIVAIRFLLSDNGKVKLNETKHKTRLEKNDQMRQTKIMWEKLKHNYRLMVKF